MWIIAIFGLLMGFGLGMTVMSISLVGVRPLRQEIGMLVLALVLGGVGVFLRVYGLG